MAETHPSQCTAADDGSEESDVGPTFPPMDLSGDEADVDSDLLLSDEEQTPLSSQPAELEPEDVPYEPNNSLNLGDSRSVDDVPLSQFKEVADVLKIQKEILKKRITRRSPHALRRDRRRAGSSADGAGDGTQLMSKSFRWQIYIGNLPGNFFTSAEAQMKLSTKVQRGVKAYKGLTVTPDNCEDMLYMYNLHFKKKIDLGQPKTTWEQFRLLVGQFCRYGVAFKIAKLTTLYRPGNVMALVQYISCADAFLQYFEIRGTSGTVQNKAAHLIRLCELAIGFFGAQGKEQIVGQIKAVQAYVRSVAKAHKYETRRQACERREEEHRIETAVLIQPQDFKRICETAAGECEGLLKTVAQFKRETRQDLAAMCDQRRWFVQKWGVNFLNLLIFYGGGQRPQAFTLLRSCSNSELDDLRAQCERAEYFELKLSLEKRVRAIDLPNLCLPAKIYKYVDFHVRHMLPLLHTKFQMAPDDRRRHYLLLHTKTGNVLDSCNVTSTLRVFLKNYDPELGKMTTMNIRSSFASLMMGRYRAGKIFKSMSEDVFLGYLAKVMNTSPEMLKETYICCTEANFRRVAAKLTLAMDAEDEDDDAAGGM